MRPIVPVDALGIEACAFIKIDVDGKELEVLRSASQLIGKHRPILYFENDERAAIKRRINDQLGSTIVEEKSYRNYR